MSRFHTVERLGTVQSTTPEGFLICEGVPISRLGTMPYAEGELPLLRAGRDGLLWVSRDEAALFDAQTMASFEGKSVVDTHPFEDVTAANWRKLAVGHVQHVRRGTGDQANLLLADLVIKDADAIREVRSGKRHVSCGYDAEYEQLEPGRARQVRILGNHVALVPEGRCGPTCSIGDTALSIKSLLERLRSAHASKDDGLFATTIAEVEAQTASVGPGGATPAIHIHTTGDRSQTPPATPPAPAPAAPAEFESKTADALGKLTEAVSAISDRLTALDGTVQAIKAAGTPTPTTPPATPPVAASVGDSAALKETFADVAARAEMLIPGVRVPTFDAAQPAAKTEEVICGFRRSVLSAALTSGTGRQHVEPVLGKQDVGTMTCDGVAMVFQGATELARISNNRGGATVPAGEGRKGPPTPAEINEANRKYWARATA